ncbi:MAG: SDR family oxidoreductase [Verrucomicrobiales bacterium]|jgi:2-hydroxycyclohexanecarboxyl-CoA dehydrogenase|nr:SDR family oxidoreductase [Verrucomicrobiales bacterium]
MIVPLTHQTVVITGAASGIGLAIAKAFLTAEADLIAIDRNEIALAELKALAPDRIETLCLNVAHFQDLQNALEKRTIDHVVCSAAVGSGKTGFPFWKLDPSDWTRVLDISLMGIVNTLHACVPSLLLGDTPKKSVLLLASVAGQIGSQTDPPYSAAKAATINYAQIAAKDFAPYGIRVNAISPGMVKTDLNRAVYAASNDSAHLSYEEWAAEKIKRVTPLGRWQDPEEFGTLAVFLASEAGRNITGQTINLDGGQVMHS